MKHVKHLLLATALGVGLSPPALAQSAQGAQASPTASVEMVEGEVRKVDKAAGKITLKHGEIKSLDMPPMTMVFGVRNSAMLDQVKAGDKIRFAASSQDGKFTVTEIQSVK